MNPQARNSINRAWKKTYSLLFGEEPGDFEGYSGWLKELILPSTHLKSSISGKDVAFSTFEYEKVSKIASFDELDYSKKFEPLSINDIKDIDSVVQAVSERACYAGNIMLGNCSNAERCTNVTDVHYATDVAHFVTGEYLAYVTFGRESNYCFGVHGPGASEFCVRCSQTVNVKRSFELLVSQNCSDCYYVYDLDGCSECLFSFHLRGKRFAIGNLELPKDKYAKIRKKLLSEIHGQLEKDKKATSLLDIMKKCRDKPPRVASADEPPEKLDRGIIESRFSGTSRLVLGRALENIDDYSAWLYRHAHKLYEGKSAISGKKLLFVPEVLVLGGLSIFPADRLVTAAEALAIGEQAKISAADAERISLVNAHETIGNIAFFNVDFREGKNSNLIECSLGVGSSDCYLASALVHSRYCSCGMWPKDSSNCFGFDTLFESNFCIDCYCSTKLSRCFEIDNSRNCTDSAFCHNCENVQNSMFCFNARSLKYAIGNSPLPQADYKKARSAIFGQVADELEKKKDLRWSIFNIGARRG